MSTAMALTNLWGIQVYSVVATLLFSASNFGFKIDCKEGYGVIYSV
jgi:hypothetical protein